MLPYLLRNTTINAPNQVWGTDITYIRLTRGWMYHVVFMDWYSRYIVSWALSDNLGTEFVLDAARRGLGLATPGISNSDQGTQYTGLEYTSLIPGSGVQVSMDGRGRAIDNVFTERFWRSLKYEQIYPNEYTMPRQVRAGIDYYINFYNCERSHQALPDHTPAELYFTTASSPLPSAVIHRPLPTRTTV